MDRPARRQPDGRAALTPDAGTCWGILAHGPVPLAQVQRQRSLATQRVASTNLARGLGLELGLTQARARRRHVRVRLVGLGLEQAGVEGGEHVSGRDPLVRLDQHLAHDAGELGAALHLVQRLEAPTASTAIDAGASSTCGSPSISPPCAGLGL
jgi:hypothetical protein